MKKKLKYIAILPILILILFGCQKQCIQCKTQFKTYLMYKGSDTITLYTYGTDEDITNAIVFKQRENFILLRTLNDSIYYENYCGKNDIENLKTMNNEKKYCYPQ